jgi:hypothetical protein
MQGRAFALVYGAMSRRIAHSEKRHDVRLLLMLPLLLLLCALGDGTGKGRRP